MNKNRKTKYVLAAICGLAPLTGVASVASAQNCVVDFDFQSSVGIPGLQLGTDTLDGYIHAFGVFDDGSGSGPALFVSGDFDNSGGTPIRMHLAKWDGSQWNEVFPALADGSAMVMVVHDDGTGEAMYLGGDFTSVGFFEYANRVAKWDGTTFTGIGPQEGPGLSGFGFVSDIAFYDAGNGEHMYVSGSYQNSDTGFYRSGVWKLENNQWVKIGLDFTGHVTELQVFDDGNGERLFAAGRFVAFPSRPDAVQINGIAVLGNDGLWEDVGGIGTDGSVEDMEVWDDGNGPALYISGPNFFHVDGIDAIKIAKWDGTQWSALGSAGGIGDGIFDMAVWDDGTGEALYATGGVRAEVDPNGDTVQNLGSIAKWDGQAWSGAVVNSTFNAFLDGVPEVMIGFNGDGNGPGLFLGGHFNTLRTVDENNFPVLGGFATQVTVVRGCEAASCLADFTGDGQLDFFDIAAFLTAFGAGDGAADFTGDGQFDFFDIAAFLTAFAQGCP